MTNNNQNTTNNGNNNGFGGQNMNDDKNQYEAMGGLYVIAYNQTCQLKLPAIFPLNIVHFEIKSGPMQLLLKFHGLDKERPYLHLREFKECAIINL